MLEKVLWKNTPYEVQVRICRNIAETMQIRVLFLATVAISSVFGATIPQQGSTDWWKHAVFYQIYPRSFKDYDNNGIGDLKGIISKLDHLKDAGVTATWLSPIYKSPQVDQGYDISDYRDIDPDYGTLDDMKALLKRAAELGVKIIMDLVPNHTSDKHKWFQECQNGNETYCNYYVWHEGKFDENGKRQPPNNWISNFGGSAWEWSEKRQQYYLHQFAKQQPDLNYRNPAVHEEIKDIIRFWLDMGIFGFRIDAVPCLYEDEELRDEPRSENDVSPDDYAYLNHIYTNNLQGTYDTVYSWRKFVDDYSIEHEGDARVLMTEAYENVEHTMLYYGTPDGKTLGAHFSFNFFLITDLNINSTAEDYVKTLKKFLDNLPDVYVPNWVFGNHDRHRVATRLGKENVDGCNMLMAVLPGVGVTYNGEEIGQENGEVPYEEGKDPSARDPANFEKFSRDFERTPFQWDTSVNAGFNDGAKPWLPVSKKYLEINLAAQNVPGQKSHYNIYKALLALRKNEVLASGTTDIRTVSNVVVVRRALNYDVVLLLFNVDGGGKEVKLDDLVNSKNVEVVVSSMNSAKEAGQLITTEGSLRLAGHEALVVRSSQVKSEDKFVISSLVKRM